MSRGKERIIRSDHFPIIVELSEMPKANVKIAKESSWNLKKPGGWETYKPAMEEASEELEKVVDDAQLSEEEVMTSLMLSLTK